MNRHAQSHPVILLVEDDPDIQEAVGMLLEEESYQLLHALNGKEAARFMDEGPRADLVLLDLTMPDSSPAQMVSLIRQRWSGVPIIILSGVHNVASVARELGADGHIEKPFDLDDLLDTLEKFTRRGK